MSVIVKGVSECERNLALAQRESTLASRRAIAAGGMYVLRALKLRMSGTPTHSSFWGRGGASGDFLGHRTGNTINRLQGGQVMSSGDTCWTAVGSPDKYVKDFEEGGAFTTSHFFRIPTAATQTDTEAASSRSLAGAFFWPSRAMRAKSRSGYPQDQFWLVRRKGGALEWLFLFKKHITQRGRHLFARTQEDAAPKVASIATLELQTVVRVGNGGA